MDRASARSGQLTISGLSKLYGTARALDSVDLVVESGELLSLLGPSGCGKTTLLRCIAGLVQPDGGRIDLDGSPLDGIPAWRRDVSVVFQSYALFPHMTVARNVAFGLKMRNVSRQESDARVREALELVEMGEYAGRMPAQLSGGQQQRVALARAIVVRPRILLLDEPMAALDAKLRMSVQREIRHLQQRLGITTILVTHDQAEAMSMSDRIAVMNAGRLEQLADPQTLYDRPHTPFVAEFIGEINRMHGRIVREHGTRYFSPSTAPNLRLPFEVEAEGIADGADATLMVRPEAIEIAAEGQPGNGMTVTVEDRVQIGDRIIFYLACGDIRLRATRLASDPGSRLALARGEPVRLLWPGSMAMVFPGHI